MARQAMGRLGTAENLFEASLTELEGLGMPAAAAQFCFEGLSLRSLSLSHIPSLSKLVTGRAPVSGVHTAIDSKICPSNV